MRAALAAKAVRLAGLDAPAAVERRPGADTPLVRAVARRCATSWCAGACPPAALRHLSMGMSHDFEAAIEEGATMVRVGTAIFGHATGWQMVDGRWHSAHLPAAS